MRYYLIFIVKIILMIGVLALVILSLINFLDEEYCKAIYQMIMAVFIEKEIEL